MVQPAPLAQSAEHSHGKAGVGGSIPPGGSKSRRWPAYRGGVAQGQSKRLIIAVSVVRVHPPLPDEVCGAPRRPPSGTRRSRVVARVSSGEGEGPCWLALAVRFGASILGRAPQARDGLGLASSTKHRRTGEADEAARPVRPDANQWPSACPGQAGELGIRKIPLMACGLCQAGSRVQHLTAGEARADESRTREGRKQALWRRRSLSGPSRI
jgi:hypothetical protein